jgi:hypothetical protein
VLIADDPFVRAGRTQARMLGAPDLPVVSVGSHTATVSRDVLRERVDKVIEQIVAGLIRE